MVGMDVKCYERRVGDCVGVSLPHRWKLSAWKARVESGKVCRHCYQAQMTYFTSLIVKYICSCPLLLT